MFWSGSAAAQSRVHRVRGTPSLLRGSPVAEMCSPTPKSVAEAGIGELTSMYWSYRCHRHAVQMRSCLHRMDLLSLQTSRDMPASMLDCALLPVYSSRADASASIGAHVLGLKWLISDTHEAMRFICIGNPALCEHRMHLEDEALPSG